MGVPWRIVYAAAMITFIALLSGCGSRGAAEFQLYNQAFNSQYEQGEAILNSVARAERIVARRRVYRGPYIQPFDPDRAAYYVENVDPPITASIRASARSLKSYNEALGALANGEAAEALSNRVGALGTNIIGAIAASEVAFGGTAAIPGADLLVSESAKTLNLALPIIKQIATYASREAFRKQLIASYPAMRELLLTLRNGTPAMFFMLERSRVVRGSESATGLSSEAEIALSKDRELLAGWVLLMDQTLVAMDAAAVAALSDAPAADLASLSEAAVELRVLAEKVKSLRSQ